MEKRRRFYVVCVLAFILLFAACSSGQSAQDEAGSADDADMDTAEQATDMAVTDHVSQEVARGERQTSTATEQSDEQPENEWTENDHAGDRKVIKNANVSMKVKDYAKTVDSVEKHITDADGYIVQTSEFENDRAIGGQLTVRIPQKSFSGFLDQLEDLASQMPRREITGTDVTEEYVDLEARLKAKRAVEERLLSFMDDAGKTEDLLKISEDLGRVQEEIEQITGRIQYLQNRISFSTVQIDIEQSVVNPGVAGEEKRHTLSAAWSALIGSTNGVMNFLSGLVVFLAGALPVIMIVSVIGVPLWIWWAKKGKPIMNMKRKQNPNNE